MRPKGKYDEDLKCHEWDMAKSMLCSWLLNVIDRKLWMSVAYLRWKILWDDLKKHHSMAKSSTIYQLIANIETVNKETWTLRIFTQN